MRSAVKSPETVLGQSFDEDERDRKTVDTTAVERQVSAVVRAENLIPTSLVDEEVSWFFNELGIEPSYFLDTPPKKLAEHVLAIFAAKVSAKARGEKQPNLVFRNVEESRAVFFHTSNKGLRGSVLEIELDDTFLDSKTDHWTLESYRSIGKVSTEYQVRERIPFCFWLQLVFFAGQAAVLLSAQDGSALRLALSVAQAAGGAQIDACGTRLAVVSRLAAHSVRPHARRFVPHFRSLQGGRSVRGFRHVSDMFLC